MARPVTTGTQRKPRQLSYRPEDSKAAAELAELIEAETGVCPGFTDTHRLAVADAISIRKRRAKRRGGGTA